MRNRGGRWVGAPRQSVAVSRVLALALGLAVPGSVSVAASMDAARDDLRWVLVSVATDTGCAVLDDGRARHLACAGEFLADHRTRLLRVDPDGAVFELTSGAAAPLHARVAAGQVLNPDALRKGMAEATGPRPGWIELTPADGAGTSPEQSP